MRWLKLLSDKQLKRGSLTFLLVFMLSLIYDVSRVTIITHSMSHISLVLNNLLSVLSHFAVN